MYKTTRPSRARTALLIGLSLLMIPLALPQPEAIAGPAGDPAVPQGDLQTRMIEVAMLMEAQFRQGSTEYLGYQLQQDSGKIRFFLHGVIDESVLRSVSNAAGAKQIDVEFLDRPYSLGELQNESRRLVETDPRTLGADIIQANPSADYSAIHVVVDSDSPVSVSRLQNQSTIPLVLMYGSKPMPARRHYASVPYHGGAMMRSFDTGRNSCSTAFGARRTDGLEVMLSAYHCNNSATFAEWTSQADSYFVGEYRTGQGSIRLDSMYITG